LLPSVSIPWFISPTQLGFAGSLFNLPFIIGLFFVSFVLGIVCLPVLLYLNWRRLSGLARVGVFLCGTLYAFPILLLTVTWVWLLIWPP
jgi:hypothetical protein